MTKPRPAPAFFQHVLRVALALGLVLGLLLFSILLYVSDFGGPQDEAVTPPPAQSAVSEEAPAPAPPADMVQQGMTWFFGVPESKPAP